MEWKEFEETKKEYPEKIVENAINGFSIATKNLLQMSIVELNDVSRITSGIRKDFQFSLYLKSEYVEDYKFKIFSFGYNVELTPISIILDSSIFEELYGKEMEHRETLDIENEEHFNLLLEKIFKTNRINEIITGLMKIARRNK